MSNQTGILFYCLGGKKKEQDYSLDEDVFIYKLDKDTSPKSNLATVHTDHTVCKT